MQPLTVQSLTGVERDWLYCVGCGSLRRNDETGINADGTRFCRDAEWCRRTRFVRLEVIEEFERLHAKPPIGYEQRLEANIKRNTQAKEERVCPCGKNITESHRTAKYCSGACRQRNKRRVARASGKALR